MSGEIRMNMQVTVNKSAAFFDKVALKTNKTFDQAGVGGPSPGRVALTTSDTVISLAGLSTPGLVVITNHDDENFCEFGPTSGGAIVKMIKLLPGMSAVFYLASGVTLRGQADTATCVISVDAYEA